MSNLYKTISDLSSKELIEEDVIDVLKEFMNIEFPKEFRKSKAIECRNTLNTNLDKVYNCFNRIILSVREDKQTFTMKELSDALNCSLSLIKSWINSGLMTEQKVEKGNVLITTNAIDEFLRRTRKTKWIQRWEAYKK